MNRKGKKRFRIRVSLLEADVAYFDARLALLGERPSSLHQVAQLRTYGALEGQFSEMLDRLRRLQSRKDGEDGLQVKEMDDSLVEAEDPSAAPG